MSGAHVTTQWVGTCHTTGKRQYTDRRRAKTVARTLGPGLAAFRCGHCDHWHTGHRGVLTREQHRVRAGA